MGCKIELSLALDVYELTTRGMKILTRTEARKGIQAPMGKV